MSSHPNAYDVGTLSGVKVLTWRVAPGMYNGCGGAVRREFPTCPCAVDLEAPSGTRLLKWRVVAGILDGCG